ncbi:DUF3048 domain-containing protein [Streptomyces bathyalis]|uniref:DUF3048 domain-containing protein n=1 Tax=Streptomyces bathyalis TaxID=2710756 RepID=A0A7T1T7J1_9ACTN|nr:DUF3048 domain-containing protein [Streptomyces bathyalis]QPP07798.1 DUF3048 domain-containing protein [Streptomyces bathyalis]
MEWTGTRRTVLLTAGLSLLGAACDSGNGGGGGGGGDEPERSPFTGREGVGDKVLAVKIDNVEAARPHTGLQKADIVYIEQVEAGLTRIMAVFASRLPSIVGPVRSARESDLELLRQYDHPGLAYSGVQSKLRSKIESAPLAALFPGRVREAYVRKGGRPAPHNLFLRPSRALDSDAASDVGAPKDIGFRFGSAPKGGEKTSGRTVRFPSARYTFDWSADKKRWLVSFDGSPARTTDDGRLEASTVVVQYVKIRDSELGDKGGNITPFNETVGEGRALVLRDGKEHEARWKRPSATDGTTFTDADGKRLAFARGQVWVVLAPAG